MRVKLAPLEQAILDLFERGKVKLLAAGEDVFYAQKTVGRDGSFGVRLMPLEVQTKEHLQAVVNPPLGRFEFLRSDEGRVKGTAARHETLLDLRLADAERLKDSIKATVLAVLRGLLPLVRFAPTADMKEERFIVGDREAALALIATLPTVKWHGKPVIPIDAAAFARTLAVVDAAGLRGSPGGVGGRLVRHRGRLIVSHISWAHPAFDVVLSLPVAGFLDLLPLWLSFARDATGAGVHGPPVPDGAELLTELRGRVEELALLPEHLCRSLVLERASLHVSRTVRRQPGVGVPAEAWDDLLRQVAADMDRAA